MPGISRRTFLRRASIGAAAAGTVAAIGPSFLGASASSASAAPLAAGLLARDQAAEAKAEHLGELMAHVEDERTGTISLYAGTRKVTFQDRAVTEALVRALQ